MKKRINFLTEIDKYRSFYKHTIDNNTTMTNVLNDFIDKYLLLVKDKKEEKLTLS